MDLHPLFVSLELLHSWVSHLVVLVHLLVDVEVLNGLLRGTHCKFVVLVILQLDGPFVTSSANEPSQLMHKVDICLVHFDEDFLVKVSFALRGLS